MYKIELNFPNLPKDAEVDILGINTILQNGHSYDVSAEEAEAFRDLQPVVSGSNKGPTLAQAFKDSDTVKVTVVKKKEEGSN